MYTGLSQGIRGIKKSLRAALVGKPLDRPFRETSDNMRTVARWASYADRGLDGPPTHRGYSWILDKNYQVTIRDLHRFRFYDAHGDVILIFYPERGRLSEYRWTRKWLKRMPLATDKLWIHDLSDRGRFELVENPWGGRKPLFVSLHGSPPEHAVALRRTPASERQMYPGELTLHFTGERAADIVHETGSFQTVITKDPDRPMVAWICEANWDKWERGTFAEEFSARMFEKGFKAPIHVGSNEVGYRVADIGGGNVAPADRLSAIGMLAGVRSGELIPYIEKAAPGENPLYVFMPPGT